MPTPNRLRLALVLVLIGASFVVLDVNAYTRTSATFDEPVHLTAGYIALATGDYRLVPEHPPLLHLWAALPLLTAPVTIQKPVLDHARKDESNSKLEYAYARQFLYAANDGDRLLTRARLGTVFLGIVLGFLLFKWAWDWYGVAVALVLATVYSLDPNVLAQSSVVTTDLGVSLFIFWSIYCLHRAVRCLTPLNALGLGLSLGLALASKFSAAILPVGIVLGLWIQVNDGRDWPSKIRLVPSVNSRRGRAVVALALFSFALGIAFFVIWAVYGFRYAPSPDPQWLFAFSRSSAIQREHPFLSAAVDMVDRLHALPNAYTQGFLLLVSTTQNFPVYVAGVVRPSSVWFYFPLAFLLKVPLSVLALSLASLLGLWQARQGHDRATDKIIVLIPAVLYAAVSVGGNLNLGFRHLMPMYPFVFLFTGLTLRAALGTPSKKWRNFLVVCLAVWGFELARVYPHNLAFFNTLAGGPNGGHRYLVESNLDWGQDLKGLAAWMRSRGVQHINLGYFGTADPDYYGIEATRLPGCVPLDDVEDEAPRLPGYVAVSETALTGLYLPERQRDYYSGLRDRTPVAIIGHSIRVYWVESGWP